MKSGKKILGLVILLVIFLAGCQSFYKYSYVESLPRPVPASPQPGLDRVHIYLLPPEEYAFEIINTPGKEIIRRNLAKGLNLDSPINIKAQIDNTGSVLNTEVVTYSGFSHEELQLVQKLRQIIDTWKFKPYASGQILYSISFIPGHEYVKVYIGKLRKNTDKCKWIGKGFKLAWSELPATLVR